MTNQDTLSLQVCSISTGFDSTSAHQLSTDAASGPLVHKSRLNTNGTFSVGKTWGIKELHGIEAINVRALHECM